MSVKDLFNREKVVKVVSSTQLDKYALDGESLTNIENKVENDNAFVPLIDFSKPQNFAKFGLAEEYYRESFNRVSSEYPYDGSEAEVNEYLNQSTYLDRYLLQQQYPRTNGYVVLSSDGWGTLLGPGPAGGSALTGGYGLSDNIEYIRI